MLSLHSHSSHNWLLSMVALEKMFRAKRTEVILRAPGAKQKQRFSWPHRYRYNEGSSRPFCHNRLAAPSNSSGGACSLILASIVVVSTAVTSVCFYWPRLWLGLQIKNSFYGRSIRLL